MTTVFFNIGQLMTLAPMRDRKGRETLTEQDLGLMSKAWMVVDKQGCVVELGSGQQPAADRAVDLRSCLVMPGLVDVHSHLLFAGFRATEFVDKSFGRSYQDIAAGGGGITATVYPTRAASDEQLMSILRRHSSWFLQQGVTSLEVKSGYGLDVVQELRQLRLYQALRSELPINLSVTALPLHATMPGELDRRSYVESIIRDFLPQVAAAGLADDVDAFIEDGYFTLEDGRDFFLAAQEHGLGLRVHADEFTRQGGACLAAQLGALSADHLQHASREDAEAMGAAGVVAVLLPGTSLYSKIPFTSGRMFREAGCRVAIASDFNPGSCYLYKLRQLISLAMVHSGLNAYEAMAAATVSAAHAVKKFRGAGTLSVGSTADFVVLPFASWQEMLADFGQSEVRSVWTKGMKRWEAVSSL